MSLCVAMVTCLLGLNNGVTAFQSGTHHLMPNHFSASTTSLSAIGDLSEGKLSHRRNVPYYHRSVPTCITNSVPNSRLVVQVEEPQHAIEPEQSQLESQIRENYTLSIEMDELKTWKEQAECTIQNQNEELNRAYGEIALLREEVVKGTKAIDALGRALSNATTDVAVEAANSATIHSLQVKLAEVTAELEHYKGSG